MLTDEDVYRVRQIAQEESRRVFEHGARGWKQYVGSIVNTAFRRIGIDYEDADEMNNLRLLISWLQIFRAKRVEREKAIGFVFWRIVGAILEKLILVGVGIGLAYLLHVKAIPQ